MSTELGLVNAALLRCGAEPLTADQYAEGTIKRAYLAKQQFPITLRECLNDTPWNFAIKRVELTKMPTTPLFGYASEYYLPNDCIRVLEMQPCNFKFDIEGRKLLTDGNAEKIKIKYIYHNTVYAEYNPSFEKAFVLKLAEDLSYGLVQSTTLQYKITAEAERYIRRARSYNSQEGTPESRYSDEYTMGQRL